MIETTKSREIGEIWVDPIDGLKVITIQDTNNIGCKDCAFATFAGGACPGISYDRHPCCAGDRKDKKEVFFRLVAKIPELQYPKYSDVTMNLVK